MSFDAAQLKKPWVKYSVLAVVVIGVAWIIYHRMGGATVVQQSGPDPTVVAAQTAQNMQQASQQFAAAQQSNTQAYHMQLDAQQSEEQYKSHALDVGAQLQLAQIARDNIHDQLGTQVTLADHNLAATVSLANISANQNITNNATNASLQQHIADKQAETQQAISSNDMVRANKAAEFQYETNVENYRFQTAAADDQFKTNSMWATSYANPQVQQQQQQGGGGGGGSDWLGTAASIVGMFL